MIYQVYHLLDFVELVTLGIAQASMALRSLNHNLDHYILFFGLAFSYYFVSQQKFKDISHNDAIVEGMGEMLPVSLRENWE